MLPLLFHWTLNKSALVVSVRLSNVIALHANWHTCACFKTFLCRHTFSRDKRHELATRRLEVKMWGSQTTHVLFFFLFSSGSVEGAGTCGTGGGAGGGAEDEEGRKSRGEPRRDAPQHPDQHAGQ